MLLIPRLPFSLDRVLDPQLVTGDVLVIHSQRAV